MPKRYWSDLKRKLTEEGSQLYENIVQLKMLAKCEKQMLLIQKEFKGLRKESLRDNMTDIEVTLADLGELQQENF